MEDVTVYIALGPSQELVLRELDGGRLLMQATMGYLDKGIQFHGTSVQLVLDPVHVRQLLEKVQTVAA